ncbi:MAG TPA: hypothetical protein VG457_07100, partial [Planctomycetota bacterium]|nr:hypothetical protein [Planctomycetota bacterium]
QTVTQAPAAIAGTLTRMAPKGAVGTDADGNLVYKIEPGSGESVYAAVPEALGSEFAGVLAANALGMFGPKEPGPTVEMVKKSILKEGVTEGLKFAGMNLTGQQLQQLGGAVMAQLKGTSFTYQAPSLLKALTGDPTALKDVTTDLALGTVLGGKGAIENNLVMDAHNAALRNAKLRADAFKRTGELTEKILSAAPEKKGELLSALADGGPNATAYVPEPFFSTYWQAQKDSTGKSVDPRELATGPLQVPGEVFDAARRTSGDFPIPRARWEELVGQTKHGRAFDDVLRTNPLESNLAEVKGQVEGYLGDMAKQKAEREADKAAAVEAQKAKDLADSSSKVRDTLVQQLTDAGVAPSEAKHKAELHAAFFRTMGSALGVDPFELSQAFPLSINRGILNNAKPSPEGSQYVRVLEQSGKSHVETVKGATRAEAVENAGSHWPDATIEPMTDEEVKNFLPLAMERPDNAITLEQAAKNTLGQPGEEGPRGNIEWGAGRKFNINLLENADKSTALHELSHFYTEVLGDLVARPDAPEGLKKDYQTH